MLLLALVLVVGLIVVVNLGRVALGGDDGVAEPTRRAAPFGLLILAIPAGILVAAVLGVGMIGLRDESGTAEHERRAPTTSTPQVAEEADPSAGASAAPSVDTRAAASDVLGPVVRLTVEQRGAVGELAHDTVLQVRAVGFEPFEAGRAMQCVGDTCANAIPVQFGRDGSASFQYLIVDDFAPLAARTSCRASAPPCSLVVVSGRGTARAELVTVFEDPLPAVGTLRVEPSRDLEEGQLVEVTLAGFVPGTDLELILCAEPATISSARCGAPGPVVPVTIGPRGVATATFEARSAIVGTERTECGRTAKCSVAVRSSSVVRARPVLLRFAAPPGADYDPTRLLAALFVALALLAVAAVLIRRTDWSPVGEEAAPEIDDAEYADLDALVALLPPDEELEDTWSR